MAEEIPDETTRILSVLDKNPQGLSIKEISAAVGMSRNSIAKYLDVLTATGRLELRHVGNAKLFTISKRVPVTNIINYARELIIVLDSNLQIMEASDSLCAFTGVPRDAILNVRLSSPPVSLLSPDEECALTSLLTGGSTWKKEIRLLRANREIFLDSRFIPTVLQNGEPGITLILEDTTERRLAERAMQERDRLLHTIFQIPSTPCFFIDRNHKVVFWDRALEILTGKKSEEMVGTNRHWQAFYSSEQPCLVDLVVDGDTGRVVNDYRGSARLTRATESGFESTEFFPHIGPSGKWLHVTATLTRDPAGNLTGAMQTVEDITEKRKQGFIIEQ